jgi:hypothetical protein
MYHEPPSLGELTARIADAGKDPASMALVVEGMRHPVAVLGRLRVPAPSGVLARKVKDSG